MDVAANLRVIQQRVAEAAERSARRAEDVTILGAAKKVPPDRVNCAIEAGLRAVGENYVQEAQDKLPLLRGPVSLHFIGHLQVNKARHAVQLFDVVQSVDSVRLAQELDKRAAAVGKTLEVLIEVNLGGEETKSGVPPAELRALAAQVAPLANLNVRGLMCMPPFSADPEQSRPFFRRLRALAEEVGAAGIPRVSMDQLSMGMTHDYPLAVEEGATLVRVGTGLFGPRP
ncbi:MAG: YggS family pyridoxal phosphate-dependent enzyme [Armatimonadetes bacterium CG_4_10_14_3_um_filter_66_18]|nr:YggS family pyridoxal phosphate-dependent enzyme [Armatimonadota bacterium]OIO98319.1 MAG: YggS family pyridoxal phosphate enzyme [Armatimonadetes bacterium CG2_30_66_41]PIU90245.1 MAG: YggS family pyridoxal phosphate-dependent enzyme [Armatimonadetes bacterium CG06_land_8_20_14_3_00_66_21]PIW21115.1 MAG: YggS family pyridoxal phosphate-dependent enzyme [Armatimonadetes bacterium CG17_big_fil_post_rev_8_21_14_2_50_66_6]PIX46069.1 MAG: YggS family pyridoxal phosphate-dependent enzyme [Armatim